MIIVSNAGPIISLAKIRQINLLKILFGKIYIPEAVYEEVVLKGGSRPGGKEVRDALNDWIVKFKVEDMVLTRSFLARLGRGESEAIALSIEKNADIVLLDDAKSRTTAEFLGLNITGTVGVLNKAGKDGLIDDFKRALDELRRKGFRLDDRTYNEVIRRHYSS